MKKVLWIVIVSMLICGALVLTACGSGVPAQRLLGNNAPWLSGQDTTETTVYDVSVAATESAPAVHGTYTVKIRRVQNADVAVGEETVTGFSGYYLSAHMQMDNGDYMDIQATVGTDMSLKQSYMKKKDSVARNGEVYTQIGKENDGVYETSYERISASGDTETTEVGSAKFKHKEFQSAPYADNTILYMLVRCLNADSATAVTLDVFQYATGQVTNARMGLVSATPADIALADAQTEDACTKVACLPYAIASTETFPGQGTSLNVYIAKEPINGVLRPICKFIEDRTTYTMISTQTVVNA